MISLHGSIQAQNMSYTYEHPRPAVTVDCLVYRNDPAGKKILLVKRKHEPYKDCWALPGGFLNKNETLHEAAVRELKEETGLAMLKLVQFHTFDAVNRDPRHRTISTVFYCDATDQSGEVTPASDASDARWIRLDELPELAFDHDAIINLARQRKILL